MVTETDIIYLEFRKVFDSVPHKRLLLKLNRLGISGNLWLWFKFYLLHCQQCVKINNQFSDFLPILSGILQCSILGPLLLLVYINDLPDHVLTSILLLFADDPKCFKTITDINGSPDLQKDVDNIDGWSINSDTIYCSVFPKFYSCPLNLTCKHPTL